MIRKIILIAGIAGILGGVFLSFIQMVEVTPLIHEAEQYEESDDHQKAGGHSHEAQEQDFNRIALTFLTNILTSCGFSFILCALFVYTKKLNRLKALGAGILGFLVFILAPALGLTPKLPGMPAADLTVRQIWWTATVFATSIGSLVIIFRPTVFYITGAIIIIAMPHIVGAPTIKVESIHLSESFIFHFIIASLITNLIYWAFQGLITGILYKKIVYTE